MHYYFAYWDTYEQTLEVDNAVRNSVEALGLNDEAISDYDKIASIYEYITQYVKYNYLAVGDDIPEAHTAYGAFVLRNCVC